MKTIIFGIKYIIGNKILHRHTPLIAGLVLTNKCNLRCRHCQVTERQTDDMSFTEITSILNDFYKEGGRTLYLEGGEPLLWHDGQCGIEDIVKYAHKKGFMAVIIYTNGTIKIETSADTVFISVDGLRKTHDLIRGKSFDRIMENISNSKNPSLFINFTINNYNKNEIEEFCRYMGMVDNIKGIFFYFHTPYYGYDDLYIEASERNEILFRLLNHKEKYKILNSVSGINSAIRNDWKRPLDICRIYENKNIYECCRFSGNARLCEDCGYLSYAEIDQALKLKPSAVFNAFKYF